MPMPEADRRRRLAAELLEQAVVAAAAADRALRAEAVGDPLEHGEVVVVEAAHQARIDAVGDARRRRARRAPPSKCASDASPRKSISCGAASTIACIAGFLRVEDAQRVAVQAALRVLVERVGVLLEVGDQRGAVRARARPAGRGC